MKKIFIIACTVLLMPLTAAVQDAYKTQVALQYEYLDFSGSKQKEDGDRKTLFLQHGEGRHFFQGAVEKTLTHTYKPPLQEDLDVTKVYLRYSYDLTPQHRGTMGYITVRDNLVPTDNGNIFALGYRYTPKPKLSFAINGYYGDYDIFDTYKVDLQTELRHRFGTVNTAAQLIVKSIFLEGCSNAFCANAEKQYVAPGLKVKMRSNGYFLHTGAFFGSRVFAVMQDGMMLQHHAMEFTDTYMVGVGKEWNRFFIKLRYVYQKAKELPLNNSGVIVRNSMVRVGYRF